MSGNEPPFDETREAGEERGLAVLRATESTFEAHHLVLEVPEDGQQIAPWNGACVAAARVWGQLLHLQYEM